MLNEKKQIIKVGKINNADIHKPFFSPNNKKAIDGNTKYQITDAPLNGKNMNEIKL